MAKTRVMHIINNLEIGGAETILALLTAHHAAMDDLEVIVVSLEGHGPLEAEIRRNGVEVVNFRYHLFWPVVRRFDPYIRIGLLLFARRWRPDVIHGHLMGGEDFAKMLGWLLGRPVVTTLHDTMIWPGRKQRFLNRFVAKAVAVSPPVAEHLMSAYRLPADRVTVIPNAIDMAKFKDSRKEFDPEHPVFIYVGRLFSTKGVEYAMEGLARLREEYPGLTFLIYGKKVFERDYVRWTSMARDNGWDFIKFLGPTSDVPDALSKGDIFVLPSQTEGFSLAVLEAAAASKPVIATRAGSIPEMVVDGESGYFVEYGSADDIYWAAKRMLDDDAVETFGERSYQIVEHTFNIDEVARSYHALYLSLKE